MIGHNAIGASILAYDRTSIRYTTRAMRKYILPTTDWSPLLGPIVKDAHPGDVLEVHTQEMWELATETIRKAGRDDLVVRLLEAPARRMSENV